MLYTVCAYIKIDYYFECIQANNIQTTLKSFILKTAVDKTWIDRQLAIHENYWLQSSLKL